MGLWWLNFTIQYPIKINFFKLFLFNLDTAMISIPNAKGHQKKDMEREWSWEKKKKKTGFFFFYHRQKLWPSLFINSFFHLLACKAKVMQGFALIAVKSCPVLLNSVCSWTALLSTLALFLELKELHEEFIIVAFQDQTIVWGNSFFVSLLQS